MKKIFVLNLRGNIIGDSIRESGLFAFLKEKYKGCYLATTGGSIIKKVHENNPDVDEFFELKELNQLMKPISKAKKAAYVLQAMKKAIKYMRGYDVCVLTQRLTYPYKLAPVLAGVKTILQKDKLKYKRPPKMYFSKKEQTAIKKFLKKGNKRVALNIESQEAARCWSMNKYIKLIELLIKNKYSVYLLGLDRDYNKPVVKKFDKKIVDLVDVTPIRQSALILKHMKLYIGNDSGLSHIAAAVDTNSITILINSTVDIMHDPKKSKVVKLRKPSVEEVFKKVNQLTK